jgi:hypothetical protein
MKFPIPYRQKNKWGFCNDNKEIIIPCLFDQVVIPFSTQNFNLSLIKKGEKFQWINMLGESISPLADVSHPFTPKGVSVIILDKENYNTNKSDRNCLFLDKEGKALFEIESITCDRFKNDTCIVFFPNRKYGAIDATGQKVIEPIFENYNDIWKELGSPMIADSYLLHKTEIDKFPMLFYQNYKYGYVNSNEEVIIEPIYIYATPFWNQCAVVSETIGQVFHINSLGKRMYNQTYYFAKAFENGIAKVVTDLCNADPFVHSRWGVDYYVPDEMKWGYIDQSGVEYWND